MTPGLRTLLRILVHSEPEGIGDALRFMAMECNAEWETSTGKLDYTGMDRWSWRESLLSTAADTFEDNERLRKNG